ncbi:GreA/GreB family elongation factor [Teredinibacter turnerae]|uniref:Transcription elongation factor GreA n=1 Tax=Teredinibacter turnerae (strain ATCC 39867 / T7901) TaxID=377629 RepID=C5BTE2_TERTT|nr:GreA/GreB family elongation factor [Teredinibacter turnerae]ACR12090.1 transcription elongation factor GreA [Teredinibacter turnerae T7901]
MTTRFDTWMTARWRRELEANLSSLPDTDAAELRTRLASATVVDNDDIMGGRVQFGSLVTVFSIDEEEEQSFQIVSSDESLSGRGLLDQRSPLAQALFGAREGEVVRVLLQNGSNCDYEVTHINVPV